MYIALLVSLAFLVYKFWNFGRRERHLPPGPPTAPILGNIHQFPPAFPQLKFSEWAKQFGNIFSLKLLNSTIVVISSPKAVKDLLDIQGAVTGGRPRSHMQMAARGLHMALEDMDTPVWKRGRKAIHNFLTPEALKEHLPAQKSEYIQFLYDVLTEPQGLYTHIKRTSASAITSLVYGKRCPVYANSDAETFFEGIKLFNEVNDPGLYPPIELLPWLRYIPRCLAPWTKHCDRTKAVRDTLYFSLFEECEQKYNFGKGSGCYMEAVLENQEKLGMSRDELVFLGGVLMDAGAETSASNLQSFVLALISYPGCQKRAQEEIDNIIGSNRMPTLEDYDHLPYLRALVKEAQRFRPILPIGLPHIATQEIPYQGYRIPKGSMIFMNIWGIFHDPAYFDEPDVFEPERFLEERYGTKPGKDTSDFRDTFAFGAGRRICPGVGMSYAITALNAMCILWAFELAPKTGNSSTMDIDSYAKPGLEMAPRPFTCEVRVRDQGRAEIIKQLYKKIKTFSQDPQTLTGVNYLLPSDEAEGRRLNLQHEFVKQTCGNNLLLVPNLKIATQDKVLDVGTGTGVWMLELARRAPTSVSFHGIDIKSKMYPDSYPRNVHFSEGSVTNLPEDWSNRFTLAHQRLLTGGLQRPQWDIALGEIYRVLRPGGWVQLVEVDLSNMGVGPASSRLLKLEEALYAVNNRNLYIVKELPAIAKKVGFVNITVEDHPFVLFGQTGRGARENFLQGHRWMKTTVLNAGGLGIITDEEEFDLMMDSCAGEWETISGRPLNVRVVCAQKEE